MSRGSFFAEWAQVPLLASATLMLCAAASPAHAQDAVSPVPAATPDVIDPKAAEAATKALEASTRADQKAELAHLHAQLATLQADRDLAGRAPDAIRDAQKALGDADGALGNVTTATHFLYLADRRIQLAQILAQNVMIEEQYKQLLAQRDQLPNTGGTGIAPAPIDTPQQEELIHNTAALKPRRDRGALHFTVSDLLVLPGTVTLDRDTAAGLVAISVYLRRNPQSQLLLVGHAPGDANDDAAMRVAQSRADGVRNYLMRLGVQIEQLTLDARTSNDNTDCSRCVDAILDPPWNQPVHELLRQ